MTTNATTSFLVTHLASIQTQITRCLAIPLVLGIFGNSASCMVFGQKQLRSSGVSRFFIAASTFNIIVLIYGVGTSFYALDHVSPDTYSLTFCKLRLYIRHILLMIVRSYIILACIASFGISSPHTSLRSLCQPRYVNWAIVLVPPAWPLIAIHMTFFNTIQKSQCVNIESYVIPFGIYFFLVVGLLPVVLMVIFISLTTRNLRRLHHRVRATVLRPARLQSRDRHFIRMLQGLVLMYVITNLFYPVNVLYSAATHWTAKSAERTAIEAIIFSITSCGAGSPTIISGFRELYKSHTFVPGLQCQVKAIDIKKNGFTFDLHWNVTTFYGNLTKDRRINSMIYFSEKRIGYQQQRINGTYPCFCARDDISVIQWNCQWRQLSLFLVVFDLIMGTLFFIPSMGMKILRERFQKESQTEQSTE
ncbi:unnamed protein product [Adineta ricciae]|uniref:G-protein coupled receptors family 1 profile domain-containing protein n=1 Tax=Adineta ricciae TaxID=249248 RepID=A0A815DK34_ADIRI|nr:unnamed protein product [Adineta ricciae]CAF1302631.1 unnamed protein product [Adineta ricciae]